MSINVQERLKVFTQCKFVNPRIVTEKYFMKYKDLILKTKKLDTNIPIVRARTIKRR